MVHDPFDRFQAFVAGIAEPIAREAIRQVRDVGASCDQFRVLLGPQAVLISDLALRLGYAAALLDGGIPGLTLRQASAVCEALSGDPALKWNAVADHCHARCEVIVDLLQQLGVPSGDIGKLHAIHHQAMQHRGGWDATTQDGQVVRFREHVAATAVARTGESWVFDRVFSLVPLSVDAWEVRLGADYFRHSASTIGFSNMKLATMTPGNVDLVLATVQQQRPDAHHYLISDPLIRDQLQQLGATLPVVPELGWLRLRGTRSQSSGVFYRGLSGLFRTGVIIEVAFGQWPFPDIPFDTVGPGQTGLVEARRLLAGLP